MAEIKPLYEVKTPVLDIEINISNLLVFNPKCTDIEIRFYNGIGLLEGRKGTYIVGIRDKQFSLNYTWDYSERDKKDSRLRRGRLEIWGNLPEGSLVLIDYSTGSNKYTYDSRSYVFLVRPNETEFTDGDVKVNVKNLVPLKVLSNQELTQMENEILNRGWIPSKYDPIRTLYYYFLKHNPFQEEETKEEGSSDEEISEEEVLAKWSGVGGVSIVEEKREEEEETKEEKEERIEITKEEIEKIILAHGLRKVKIVVFELPSEYKGAEVKFDASNRHAIIKFSENVDITKIRTLRRQFYRVLRKYAWRSLIGWVLFRNADMNKLNNIISALNKELGTERAIYVVESYFPAETLVEWISTYIAEVKMKIEEVQQKIEEKAEELKTVRRLKSELKELETLLKNLENEMKYLKVPSQ